MTLREQATGATGRARDEVKYDIERGHPRLPRGKTMTIQEKIHEQVTGHPVVLYMKGTPQFPQCGFSAAAVQMLQACGIDQFFSVNVLADPEIRQGVKDYANWPTIPQLYVSGEFVGGCDIMREMYESGELQQLLARQAA
jgi:monothiol glutaredoxin